MCVQNESMLLPVFVKPDLRDFSSMTEESLKSGFDCFKHNNIILFNYHLMSLKIGFYEFANIGLARIDTLFHGCQSTLLLSAFCLGFNHNLHELNLRKPNIVTRKANSKVSFKPLRQSGFQKIAKLFDCINSKLIRQQQNKRMGILKKLTHPNMHLVAAVLQLSFWKLNLKSQSRKCQKLNLEFRRECSDTDCVNELLPSGTTSRFCIVSVFKRYQMRSTW